MSVSTGIKLRRRWGRLVQTHRFVSTGTERRAGASIEASGIRYRAAGTGRRDQGLWQLLARRRGVLCKNIVEH